MRPFIFHPAVVLLVSALITAIFIVALLPFRWLMTPIPNWVGDSQLVTLLYYHAPIVFAFVSFLFDRAQHWQRTPRAQWIIETLVIGLAFLRVIRPLPFYSGHAIFLAYAILTLSSQTARLIAMAVLLDVVYFKLTYFNDATLVGGIILGALAGLVALYLRREARGRIAKHHT